MIIFAVSSSYLGYLEEETEGYDFALQGYGNIRDAIGGLVKSNPAEIYGFTLVLDVFPDKLGLIVKFLERCNMLSAGSVKRKRFVLASSDTSRVGELLKGRKFGNMDIHVCSFNMLTDEIIKKDIFGTILAGYHNPYEYGEEPRFDRSKFTPGETLRYLPVFNVNDLLAIEDIVIRGTKKETIIEDEHLEKLERSSEFHYRLRLFAIDKAFDEKLDSSLVVDKLLLEIPEGRKKIHYNLLYKYVKEVDLVAKTERVFA